jgi:hypothetical protein
MMDCTEHETQAYPKLWINVGRCPVYLTNRDEYLYDYGVRTLYC